MTEYRDQATGEWHNVGWYISRSERLHDAERRLATYREALEQIANSDKNFSLHIRGIAEDALRGANAR